MLVLIDESGDAGFKLGRGSSRVFSVAMVIFRDTAAAEHTSAAIKALQARRRIYPEFKFSKASHAVRDAFFETVKGHDFTVRAIVVEKDKIASPHLKAYTKRFYGFFVRMMMTHDGGALAGARVKIDGSGSRKFKIELAAYLRRQTRDEALGRITFNRSHTDHLIQLADMVSGAIHRSYHPDKKHHDRWRRVLRPRIEDVWEFS